MNNVWKDGEELIDKGKTGFEAAKQKLSNAMEAGSDKIIAGTEAIEGTALYSAESLMDGANYLRTQPASKMWKDCGTLCSKYPLQAMAAAAFAGVLIGKSIWGPRPRL